jgi:hypothetical protein
VPDTTLEPSTEDYLRLGFVANPFPPVDESASDPLWVRLVTRAATNQLAAALMRGIERSRPVLITMSEEIPDYYVRLAVNGYLFWAANDPELGTLALNTPLEMMRLGRIRATLIEIAERLAAMDFPASIAAYLADTLIAVDPDLPEAAAITAGELEAARMAFATDAHAAVERFLGPRPAQATPSQAMEQEAVHAAYLRTVGQDVDPAKDEEPDEAAPSAMDPLEPPAEAEPEAETPEPVPERDPDLAMRDYIVAFVGKDISPVVGRTLRQYGIWGETILSQELKVTKAPRKTLAALLRLMNHRWKRIVVIYDSFDNWPMIETQMRNDILAALTELRWIVGEAGVMAIAIPEGKCPQIEEQFAAAETLAWTMPEIARLYEHDVTIDPEVVQRWLDSASISGESAVRLDGPELAPIVEAADDDVLQFALMAETAFRDAAARGLTALDEQAVNAGVASCSVEEGS